MEKFYAIDWMVEDNFNFNNKEENEQKRILLDEIDGANEIYDMNIELIEIENVNVPGGLTAIIIKATKDEMINLGFDEIDIDEFEVFIK